MPRRTRAHVLDDETEQALRSALPTEWVFRTTDRHDYGIDGTIEVFEGEQPSGEVFYVQLKGTDADDDGSGSSVSIKVDTANYWGLQQLPTLLARYHSHSGNLYARWSHRSPFDPDPGQVTFTVRFEAEHKWSEATPDRLVEEVRAYHLLRSARIALPVRLHVVYELDQIAGVPTAAVTIALRSAAERLPRLVDIRTDVAPPGAATLTFHKGRTEIDLGGSGISFHHDVPYGDGRSIDAIGFDSLVGISFALGRIGLVSAAASIAGIVFPLSTFVRQQSYAARVAGLFQAAHRVAEGVGLARTVLGLERSFDVVTTMATELDRRPGESSVGDEARLAQLFAEIAGRAETDDPSLAAATWRSAARLQQQSAPQDAVASLRRAAAACPGLEESADWQVSLAGAAYDASEFETAISAYRSALALTDAPETAAALADSLLIFGRFGESNDLFEKVSRTNEIHQKWSVSRLLAAHLADSVENGWPEALEAADADPPERESGLPQEINFARSWFNRGVSWSNDGNHEEALYCYLSAVILFPGDDEGWVNSLLSAMLLASPELVAAVVRSGYERRGYEFLDELMARTHSFPIEGIKAVMEAVELFIAPIRSQGDPDDPT